MTDAGFFRGTSSEQDNRFSDKEKKLLKQMKFADNLTTKVEMNKIKLDVLKPWISKRISELLGMEDDVVVEFVINQLEAEKNPDARKIQINLTGFLNGKNARIFTGELWGMLISAQESSVGIPASMVEAKKEEIKKRNEEQERINETLKRTVSRFNDRLKQERESPPPSNRRDRSPGPDSTTKDRARSKSKDRESKTSRPPTKPGDSDGKRSSPDPSSKSRDDTAKDGKRNYRSRRSSSASPEPNNRRRSRSKSLTRDKRPPQRDLMEEIKEQRRSAPDRDRGGRDYRERPRRSRSPVLQRSNKRSRSRSPLRGRSRRSPSPRFRRRSPAFEPRYRQNRDPPPRRDVSIERPPRRFDDRRSRSRSPGRLEMEHRKHPSTRLLPDLHSNSAHPNNNKTAKRSASPEPVAPQPAKKPSKSGSSSGDESSSTSGRETEKLEKSAGKKKASASEDSSNSEEDQLAKKRKDKKKKKDKKHKKHKKHKKLKKSKKHSSEEEDGSQDEEDDNGQLPSSRIAKSFLKLVEPNQKLPSSEDLERKLREKALMSMKKAATSLNR